MTRPRLPLLAMVFAFTLALLAGAVSAKTITGTARNDVLRGTAAADTLYGKGGADKLYGLAGNDRVVGGPGNDLLVGGAGADTLSCGPGRDTASADAKDRVGADCEVVRGVPKRTPPPPAPPSPPPAPPLPGQKVDVGGYALYLECAGSASPTVVVEQGSPPAPATVIRAVQSALASETRVCFYDRAGVGASDPRPAGLAPTGTRLSSELRTLLANANVPGPYVLAAPSFGGLLSVSHAVRYPSDFVGFVFIDALTPWNIAAGAGNFEGPEPVNLSAELGELQAVQFGSRPVLALVSEYPEGRELVRRSSNRMLLTTPGISHFILREAPQLAIAAIRVVVASARAGAPLPACEQTPLPGLGGKCEAAD